MKPKGIIAISLLLFILLIGAVSAADADNSTLEIDDSPQEIISNSSDERVSPDVSFGSYSGEHYVTDDPELWVELKDENISGTVAVQVNGVEKINTSAAKQSFCFELGDYGGDLKYNTPYNISLLYSGDERYLPWNVTDVFTLNHVRFDDLTDLNVDVQQWASTYLPMDARGKVSLYVDGKLYGSTEVDDGEAFIWLKGFTYGIHTYEFRYSGDKKYPAQNRSGTFNVSYILDVDLEDGDTFLWANDVVIDINTPAVCDEITLIQNGNAISIPLDEYGNALYTIKNLKYGENTLVFDYKGDQAHPARTITRTINVIENIECPQLIEYASGDAISVRLPGDAEGSIVVLENGTEIAAANLTNGTAKIDLSFLGIGCHNITVSYTGDDYGISYDAYRFKTIPYIKCPNSIGADENGTLSVILPEDADGYVTIEYKHELVANKSVVNGNASFDLDFLNIAEEQLLTVTYNSTRYGDFTRYVEVNVRKVSKDGQLIIEAPKTVVFDSSGYIYATLGLGAEGNVTFTIENNSICAPAHNGEAFVSIEELASGLEFKEYSLKVLYSGDDYYKALENETTLKVSYISFTVPETVIIGEVTAVHLLRSQDATGDFNLYIDGKYVKSTTFIEYGDDCYEYIDLSDLDFGEYRNVEFKYMGDSRFKPYSERHAFNVTYAMGIDENGFAYGDPVEVVIDCWGNINGNGILTIDGKNYTVALKKGHGSVMIPYLDLGKHNATVFYKGDSVYPERTAAGEFEVIPKIKYGDSYHIDEGVNVSLKLPSDANGNLVVKVYDDNNRRVLEKSEAVRDGIGTVSINELKLGMYSLYAYYDGTDYDVEFIDDSFSLGINVNASDLEIGRENNILIEMPSDATGNINFTLSDGGNEPLINKTYEINGNRIVIPINGLDSGDYEAEIDYAGNYGNYSTSRWVYIAGHKPAVSVSIPKEIIAKDTSTITFTLPKDATGEVYVIINEEVYYGDIINGKASVKITPQRKGIQYVSYGWEGNGRYEEWSDYTYINVLKTPTIKAGNLKMYYNDGSCYKVTVRDSFGKLVVGKYVAFYINGKKVKSVKTDKKGVAKLKVTKLPGTYKITAKYRGASVTKKLTVKQVLTLKAVKVKRSAKKLVLTATLKKGKKAIKNAKITFKFKGKTYKAKTNKNGVAKVTIKKSALKKLKVGKTVKYQATYLKDTVKKSAKVKR